MRVNEMKLDNNLMSLLTELFSMKGAKEIFKKHNIEIVTEQIEKEGLTNFIKQAKELFKTSDIVKEYNQAVQFLDLQINTNKSSLSQAEGFMKTMIEGMIKSFETTKKLAIQNFSPTFREELKGLLHNIVNEEDKKQIEKYIEQYDITELDEMLKNINSIILSIESRYSENERKVSENISDIENANEDKEKAKKIEVEQNNLFDEPVVNEQKVENKHIEKPKKDKDKVEKIEEVEEVEEAEEVDVDIDGLDLNFLESNSNKQIDLETDKSFNEDDPIDDEEFSKFLDEDESFFDDTDDGVELDF